MKIVKLDSLLGTAWSHTYNLANLDDESLFTKGTELLWSTYLGDNATSSGQALAGAGVLFLAGGIRYDDDVDYAFKPLCDPGDGAYFKDDPYIIVAPDYQQWESYLVGFDMSEFPDVTTGITDFFINNGFIYPNPGNDFIMIKNNTINQGNIKIYNTSGQLVKSITDINLNAGFKIDIKDLSAGLYTLICNNNFSNFNSYKFIKQ